MDIMRSRRIEALAALTLATAAGAAAAQTTAFTIDDFRISTTTLNSVFLSADPASAPALPDAATFTLVPDQFTTGYLPMYDGKFARLELNLPATYADLTFDLRALVNDQFAVYVNGTVVAIQASTTTDNFVEPLPGFALNAAGAAADTSGKLEYVMAGGMQGLFHAGANEIALYGVDTLQYGAIVAIEGSVTTTPGIIPEPGTWAMLLAGLSGLGIVVRRRGGAS
jgi:hypothetical protein